MNKKILVSLCLGLGASLAACGNDSPGSDAPATDAKIVYAVPSDPGNLDPQTSSLDLNRELARFGYDYLVNRDAHGAAVSGLASSWVVGEAKSTFKITSGVTCSDGSKFTADTAAKNLKFVIDPKNGSPFASSFPAGTTVSASDTTLTIKTPTAPAFLLVNLADIPMICDSGLKDRDTLAAATAGTGPYVLTASKTGASYTYERRDDYTWGPGGTRTEKGQPKTIEVRIVADETTAANLLVSGDVNLAVISGADGDRLLKISSLIHDNREVLRGLIAFNEADGRVTQDQTVREALSVAVDWSAAREITTGGHGEVPTSLLAVKPKVCPGNTIEGNLPAHDVDRAKKLLDQAGWVARSDGQRTKNGKQLTLDILTPNFAGPGYTDGADFIASQWRNLGIKVTVSAVPNSQLGDRMFKTANFDVTLVGSGERTPNQNSQYFSGSTPPNGTNFASLRNPTYDQAVQGEAVVDPKAECARWDAAEIALFKEYSLIAYANMNVPMLGNGVRFDTLGNFLVPTSLRTVS
ncbi:ABC transporter substrate-binding protein [Nonomuraea sp. B12E4]|uniref:ABC transporter substrate-binding protein n=1 Tax=Nonomuraea sp. B12E4 TaxID=3153564 RepID=UPI00325E9338